DLTVLPTSVLSGGTFDLSYTVRNFGNRDTRQAAWLDSFFLSRDPSYDKLTDIALGGSGPTSVVKADALYSSSLQLTLPENISGDFYIVAFTDAADGVQEFQGEG